MFSTTRDSRYQTGPASMWLPRQYLNPLIIMFPLVASFGEAVAIGRHYIVLPESTSAARLPLNSPNVLYVPLDHPPFGLAIEYQEAPHALAFTVLLQADNKELNRTGIPGGSQS